MEYQDLTKKEKKELAEYSGYSLEELETEQPYLVVKDDWERFADEEADEYFDLNGAENTIANYFDWEKWEHDLKYDYTEVEVGGETYLMRAW
jgi:hypothetical protein